FPVLGRQQHQPAAERAVLGCGMDARLGYLLLQDMGVCVREVIPRANDPFPHPMPSAEVVGQLEPLDRLLELCLLQIVLRYDVVVDVHVEVPSSRLPIDQAVRLDRGFLRLAPALDRDSALEAPFRRPAVRPLAPWVLVENVLEYLLEIFVGLKLVLD